MNLLAVSYEFELPEMCSKTHLPPRKCLPLNHFVSGFGAVKLTSEVGLKSFPGPELGGPDSMFHEDGASTEVTSTLDLAKASMTGPNGSLTSPVKLNPIFAVNETSSAADNVVLHTKDRIDHMICLFNGGMEVIYKGYV